MMRSLSWQHHWVAAASAQLAVSGREECGGCGGNGWSGGSCVEASAACNTQRGTAQRMMRRGRWYQQVCTRRSNRGQIEGYTPTTCVEQWLIRRWRGICTAARKAHGSRRKAKVVASCCIVRQVPNMTTANASTPWVAARSSTSESLWKPRPSGDRSVAATMCLKRMKVV